MCFEYFSFVSELKELTQVYRGGWLPSGQGYKGKRRTCNRPQW